jgi:hypothetical protein
MTKKISFPDFETKMMTELLLAVLEKKGFHLTPAALGELPRLVDELSFRILR